MANASSMTFNIFGKDVSASKALDDVGKKAHGAGKMLAVGIAAGAAGAALAIGAFAKESIDKFGEVAGETAKLQRYLGGTAEDASRLRSAFKMTGVATDTAAKSMGIFSKFSSTAGDQLNDFQSKQAAATLAHKAFSGRLGASASAFATLGVSLRGANGETRPMKDLLLDMADQISKMPNGIDKTTLVLKAFGKGGMAMLPFLNKGKKGVEELMAESDKLGTTLSGKDLAAVKENTIAKRKWGEAMDGVQITVGKYLFPILTKLATWFVATLIPGIRMVTEWLVSNLGPAFSGIAEWITGTAIPAFQGLVTMFMQNVWPALQSIGAMIAENLQPIIAALAEFWTNTLLPGIQKLIPIIAKVAAVFGGIIAVIAVVVSWILGKLIPAFLWVASKVAPIVIGAIGFVVNAISGIGTAAKAAWDWVSMWFGKVVSFAQGLPGKIGSAVSGMWDGIKDAFRSAINFVIDLWNNFHIQFPSFDGDWNGPLPGGDFTVGGWTLDTPNIPHLASGGVVSRPTLALIGEAGPEAVVPLSRGGGMGGVNIYITQPLGTPDQIARAINNALSNARGSGTARLSF